MSGQAPRIDGAKVQARSDFESFGDSCLFVFSTWVTFIARLLNSQ